MPLEHAGMVTGHDEDIRYPGCVERFDLPPDVRSFPLSLSMG
jgi:hypothetical protein